MSWGAWGYTDETLKVVFRMHDPSGAMESCIVIREDVQEWVAKGNTILEPFTPVSQKPTITLEQRLLNLEEKDQESITRIEELEAKVDSKP